MTSEDAPSGDTVGKRHCFTGLDRGKEGPFNSYVFSAQIANTSSLAILWVCSHVSSILPRISMLSVHWRCPEFLFQIVSEL